jgi:CSLREA domain-containing protein
MRKIPLSGAFMKSRRHLRISASVFIGRRWLIAGLISFILGPWALLLARPVTVLPLNFHSPVISLNPAGLTITVNTTGDGDGLDPNTNCDVDAGTPGEQCTLRAAIQRANAVADEDTIDFNIPANQPNCDGVTGKCTIKLTKRLPDLGPDIVINGPGIDKLTVRRDTGGDYPIFVMTTGGTATVAHLRIENGRSNIGGAIANIGSATLSLVDVVVFGSFAQLSGGALHNESTGTVNKVC